MCVKICNVKKIILLKVSAEVESRFESHHSKEGSRSTSDITTLDLLWKHLTHQIQQSTQAHSETQVGEKDSPSRRAEPLSLLPCQTPTKMQTFV